MKENKKKFNRKENIALDNVFNRMNIDNLVITKRSEYKKAKAMLDRMYNDALRKEAKNK
jgi:uncharacterized protein VirK/YbjX